MASGDQLVVFDALAHRPPDNDYASLDLRGGHPVLDFGDAVDEASVFQGVLPAGYAGGDLRVSLIWAASSATTGDVVWEGALERHEVGVSDLDVSAYGTGQTVVSPASGVSGATSQAMLTLPAASLSGVSAGEPFRLRITRLATDAGDTVVGDAELFVVEVQEV